MELDAYPRINDVLYAYLNLGYSASSIFPDWRSGGELFMNLPSAWEASLGYRQLRYDGHPTTLITGAVGKYVGNYWVSVRPFVRPSSSGTTATTLLQARRYFADGDHFVGARFAVGNAPPDLQPPDAASLAREHSVSVAVQGSGDLAPRLLGTWLLGYERERLLANRTRTGVSASAGVRVRL
jgi:YaiO family outer membrane protein